MRISKPKVTLSRRLKAGVGRKHKKKSYLPYVSGGLIVLSAVLAVRAGYIVVSDQGALVSQEGQVLGAADQQPSNTAPVNTTPKELFTEYAVEQDDTIFTIAESYKIEWTTLATLNNLKAPFELKPGDTVKIPNN